MRYFLENDNMKVEIDSLGAEVKSVIRKDHMREYMWYGNPEYWGRTSPVLFPFVGSLKDKKYIWKGREYAMGQHGFARDMEFQPVGRTEEEIWFQLESGPETLAKYPFPFVLQIGYRLVSAGETDDVLVMWKVMNPADDTMYFSIGAHPAFLCPVHGPNQNQTGRKAGCRLYFEGADTIYYYGLDTGSGLALRENIELGLDHGYVPITEDFFDRSAYIVEGSQTGRVGLADEEGRHIVDVCFDTPLFAVWSPEKKDAPFICIEPWYGRCDAVDFEGDLSRREFTNILRAGGTFEGGYTMKFFEYRG